MIRYTTAITTSAEPKPTLCLVPRKKFPFQIYKLSTDSYLHLGAALSSSPGRKQWRFLDNLGFQ